MLNKPICYSVQLEFGLNACTQPRLRDLSLNGGGGNFCLQEIFVGGHHIHFTNFRIHFFFSFFESVFLFFYMPETLSNVQFPILTKQFDLSLLFPPPMCFVAYTSENPRNAYINNSTFCYEILYFDLTRMFLNLFQNDEKNYI